MYKLILFVFLFSCGSSISVESTQKTPKVQKWSVRMANTVIHHRTALYIMLTIILNGHTMLHFSEWLLTDWGKTIRSIQRYMEDWVNYFVKPDGSVKDYNPEEYNLDRIFPGRNVITVYKRNPDR